MKELPFHITTIIEKAEFQFKEKGSLFISQVFHVDSEETATNILKEIRKIYFDATHNCYAYKLSNGASKYSDDGEPNGTAGIRILNAINHENLFNLLVIVTRYFGGTKLGVGPLGKAYYDSAIEVLKISKKISQQLYLHATIQFDFEFSNLVHRMISKYSIKIVKTEFSELTIIECLIPDSEREKFVNELTINSLSKIKIEVTTHSRYI
ncbi:MAG: YigZ family protein [Melioribacter sp.]|nr:YigZ family protein [Melioribacter sp.]